MRSEPSVWLKPGKEKPMNNRHPWVFSGAIAKTDQNIAQGQIVDVRASDGRWLARGYYNEKSQIRCRILTWDETQKINQAFWTERMRDAILARSSIIKRNFTTAVRIVFGEADCIPGLIVDLYEDIAVMQSLTAGIDANLGMIVEALRTLGSNFDQPLRAVYERSDEAVRTLEGIEQRSGVLWTDGPANSRTWSTQVWENGMRFNVDIATGHKTGFYVDQRDARHAVKNLGENKTVLNCFSYTGGFSVAAALGGAKAVTSIDASAPALEIARQNFALNNCQTPHETICGDVFEWLRKFKDDGERFDLVILDPPKFANNSSQVDKACRAYKDINRIAMQIVNPGGWLASFSCSGLISADLFQKVVFSASREASVDMQIMQRLRQGSDHPVLLTFPEAEYLKGLLCRRLH